MFCQQNACDKNCTLPCREEYRGYNLLPQYHTQNPIIQNPNLNKQIQTNHEKPTPIPKHIYTNLKTYPIYQILDTIETTRKDRYHTTKKEKEKPL